jgi:hypothetical protein
MFTACVAALLILNMSIAQNVTLNKIKFIGEFVVPHNQVFKYTIIGGLSGIDYDSTNKVYYMISDDRSDHNPARYYTAKINFTDKKIDTVQFTDVTFFKAADGKSYPNSRQDPSHTPDPEALRYNPVTKQMIWSSEGERIVNTSTTVLENPAITLISPDGKYIDTLPLPSNLLMHSTEKGPRQNGTLEGLTFADHFKTLFVSLEEPLYEDGPRADIIENKPYIRLFKYDLTTKNNTAQYAYKLEPIAHPGFFTKAFKINGIPDILSIGNNKLLVMERSFSTGRLACTIRLFLTDLNKATNIKNIPSLKTNTTFIPASKKLLLNMDDLGIYIDNIEGVTFGPNLPNGHKTLVFVADNNFSSFEKTQFLLFEVVE